LLQRFYFPLHPGIEIRLFNLFHGFKLFPCSMQSHASFLSRHGDCSKEIL
jgi:hypothetical protein